MGLVELRHIVIFIYIAELVCFAALSSRCYLLDPKDRKIPLLLTVLMVVRLLIKLVYFYVEFYIASWHLNILFNASMDTTYVLSIYLTIRLMARAIGRDFPKTKLYKGAAISYVVGFVIISYLWVDRASNHNILIAPGVPQLLYSANELFFLIVAYLVVGSVLKGSALEADHGIKDDDARRHVLRYVRLSALAVIAYVLYVYLWDMSFLIPGLDALRLTKPVDGVLFFSAALLALFPKLAFGVNSHLLLGVGEEADSQPGSQSALDDRRVEDFSSAYRLTAREQEVLRLLVEGDTIAKIADSLGISANTAKRHVYNIYHKADVHNRYELLRLIADRTVDGG